MDRYIDALVSKEKNSLIPDEDDWFAPLIGDWKCDYYEPESKRQVKGEWYFRRALDGMAILDVFIFPSRETREIHPQPDAEYGAAIRMYNKDRRCYDMTYTCASHSRRLEIRKENEKIVCTVVDDPKMKWAFSKITENTFYWENSTVGDDGTWQVNCEVRATRI